MFNTIIKRDGREVPYDISKISTAIFKAMEATGSGSSGESARLAAVVETELAQRFGETAPGVEDIQDVVELVLNKTMEKTA